MNESPRPQDDVLGGKYFLNVFKVTSTQVLAIVPRRLAGHLIVIKQVNGDIPLSRE